MSNGEPVGVLDQVGIDVQDLDRSAKFWQKLLGLKVSRRGDNYLEFERQGNGPQIYIQKVPEKKTSKTRVHLDISVKDLDASVAKAEDLGATTIKAYFEDGKHWVWMEDPDGNEFCLCLVQASNIP